jgi:DNA-binding transcriptional MerR regulator
MKTRSATSWRIDDLAQLSGIASGTIRFYQREGLIPPPEREGRVAYYGPAHLQRLERVRALQAQGLPLGLVGDLLEREERGEDIEGWLALDTAVFAERNGWTPVPPGAFERLGMDGNQVDALVSAGLLRRRDTGLEAAPGVVELTARLLEAGVQPSALGEGTALVAERLRAVADAMAALGWEIFAPDRRRIESDEPVAEDVLRKLEDLRELAQRIVTTLFPHMLDEAVRRRSEPYAVDVATRRTRG